MHKTRIAQGNEWRILHENSENDKKCNNDNNNDGNNNNEDSYPLCSISTNRSPTTSDDNTRIMFNPKINMDTLNWKELSDPNYFLGLVMFSGHLFFTCWIALSE